MWMNSALKIKKESVRFGPATEFLFSQEELKSGIEHLEEGLTKTMQKLSDDKLKTTVLETVSHEIEMLKKRAKYRTDV